MLIIKFVIGNVSCFVIVLSFVGIIICGYSIIFREEGSISFLGYVLVALFVFVVFSYGFFLIIS